MSDTKVELQILIEGQKPAVRFMLNQGMDIQTAVNFLERKKAGVDFGAGIIKKHPALSSALHAVGADRERIISEYVQGFYRENRSELEDKLGEFEKEWEVSAPEFFRVTDEVFEGYRWPQGKYVAYLSIFNCNPRFLENKTFQAYYQNKAGILHNVSHEMLHFIFYDWLNVNLPDFVQQSDKERIWQLSEVFDILAFEQPQYKKFKSQTSGGYTELEIMAAKLREGMKDKPFTIWTFMEEARKPE